MKNAQAPALIALFAGAFAIGVAPIWVRLSDLGPSATAFYRLLFAQPCFWIWMFFEKFLDKKSQSKNPNSQRSKPESMSVILKCQLFFAGLLFALDMVFWHWSILKTSVANSTLLTNAAPIFVTLGAWFWFHEKITRRFIEGLLLAILGAAILSGESLSRESAAHLQGDGIALLAAVFYGAYMLSVKQLRESLTPVQIMAWSGIASTISLGIIAWISGEHFVPQSKSGWGILIALAITGQVAGQTLIAFAFKHLPASFSSVGLLFQPAVAAFLSWMILNETMNPMQIVGAIIILLGIFVCRRN